jgi:large subunit ribosomal protein L4
MIKVKNYSPEGKENGEVGLATEWFGVKINDCLLWEYVKTFLANQRQGTTKGKGRSEVSGGGRKPWKQKGTGNARAGSNTSPIWVRGGKAFHPNPVDHRLKLPKKKKKYALQSALSLTVAEKRLRVIENVTFSGFKTKRVIDMLQNMGLVGKKNLLVTKSISTEVYKSTRNVKNLSLQRINELNAYDVLRTDNLLIAQDAIEALQRTI